MEKILKKLYPFKSTTMQFCRICEDQHQLYIHLNNFSINFSNIQTYLGVIFKEKFLWESIKSQIHCNYFKF